MSSTRSSNGACARSEHIRLARLTGDRVSEEDRSFETRHRQQCAQCRQEQEALEQLRFDADGGPIPPLDDVGRTRMINQVLDRFEEEPRPSNGVERPSSLRPLVWRVSLAAAGVALLAAGLLLFLSGDTDRHPLGLGGQAKARVERPALTLLMVSGRAQVGDAAAVMGKRLTAARPLTTTEGAVALALDRDGALLTGPHTVLSLRSDTATQLAVQLERGTVYGRMSPGRRGRRLVIQTPHGRVVITGTVFAVRVAAGETTVSVLRGTVSVEAEGREPVSLGRGMRVRVGVSHAQAVPPAALQALRQSARQLEFLTRGEQASLRITSHPAGAPVRVDGLLLGHTPLQARAPSGEHELVLAGRDHASIREFLSLDPGVVYRRDFQLKPLPKPSSVRQPAAGAGMAVKGGTTAPPPRRTARPRVDRALSLAALLKKAHRLLARRDWRGAITTYKQIRRQHPRSGAALSSLVSLGTLHLDRLGQPSTALRYFDRYLRQRKNGLLAQEAAFGRLRALRRLGRRSGEIAGLRAFVQRYPRAVQARQARKRLRQLSAMSPR